MKKILIIVVLMMSVFANAQKQKAIITLNSGTVKQGFAKIRGQSKEVKFRTKKGAKKELVVYKNIKSISISEGGKMVTYEVKYEIDKKGKHLKTPYLYEVIIKGNVSLYAMEHSSSSMMMGSNGMTTGGGGTSVTYYLSRGNNRFVTTIAYFGNLNFGESFKKRAIKYFNDCPDLVKKIKNKVFRKRDIKKIVKYYNSNCGK